MTSEQLLRKTAWEGIVKRYKSTGGEVKKRFEREMTAIVTCGFVDYLLILWDLYDFMDQVGIPYGPGRGSAAASIVCYALGITGVCPLEYDLLFERFINIDRISAPDIDIDISTDRRGEVIEYLKERWGHDRVAQIITYGTLGAPAAIRDMARTMYGESALPLADKLAKLIPKNGSLTTDREDRHYIDETLKTVPDFKKLYDEDKRAKAIVDAARDVEGIIKNESVHAAGIVIADKPIVEYAPLITTKPKDKNAERPLMVAYAMNELEHIGLIKFDLLGISTLDVIDDTIRSIKKARIVSKDFDIERIPLDDPKTFSLLGLGLTQGVFQFESAGMAGWLRKLKPDRLEDLIAMVALYRPGPMAFIETYVDRKLGNKDVAYPHKRLKETLEATYGIAIYQEQLMQIGVVVAGWSLSRADQLRKVIGKKIVDKIAGERKQFADDAEKNGYDWDWADTLFEKFIEPAARYSFNKGHATVYGLLAYRTAYLKANYSLHYISALLANVAKSTKANKADKIAAYIADARALGIAVLPPDIHESGMGFTPVFEKKAIRYGLLAIKNVGDKAIQVMVKERDKNGPFTDLFDFVTRTRNRLISTRTIESLIFAGALDQLPGTREEKAASVIAATDRASMQAEDSDRVAAGGKAVNRKKPIPECVLLAGDDSINLLSRERELLGTYISGHPFNDIADEAARLSSHDLQELRELAGGDSATICGIVSTVNKLKTKKGGLTWYTLVVEDNKCTQEVLVFARQAKECGDLTEYLDKPIVIFGKLESSSEDEENANPKFILDKMHSLGSAPIRRKAVPVVQGSVKRIHLTYDNYAQLISRMTAPCSFILPDGQELICK